MAKSRLDWLEVLNYSANPTDTESGYRGFAAVGTTPMFWNGTSWVTLSTGGSGSTPTWEQIYGADNTFNIASGNGWTVAGAMANANNVVTLTADASATGAVLAITHNGSGVNDVLGTSSTWKVTNAGVATFAGISISGTTAALASTDDATWTIKDNDTTSLRIGPSGGPVFLTFDTSNSAEVLSTNALTFQVTLGKTNLIQGSNTISALVVTDNTITTFGADADSAGMAVFRSTSLTTGSLVQLQLTEGTLNGGFYLTARDVTAARNVFTIGEDGAVVIAGEEGNAALTLTKGDAAVSDGSLAITDDDDAASFSVTNNTATTASVVAIAGSGVFTGSTTTSFMTITASGLTTGTAVYLVANALTTGKGMHVVANALTTGQMLHLAHTTSVIADGGSMLRISSTSIDTGGATNGTLLDLSSTAQVAGVVAQVATALTTGGALLINSSGTMTTTGYLLTLTANSATTAAGIFRINGNGLTSGIGAVITSSATAITGAGRLLRVDHTGATSTSGILSEFASAANDETVIVKITASDLLALGIALDISAAAMTTGKAIDISNLDAITTGKAIHVDATGTTHTDGILVHLDSAGTAISSTGRIFLSDHTGATTTSGILNEFKSAANDETVIVQITASDVNALGTGLLVSTATTTGTGIKVTANAVTTGQALLVQSSVATTVLTTTGRLFKVDHTGNATGSGTIAEIASAAADETVIFKVTASAALAAGVAVDISAAALTTGKVIDMSDLDAITTGKAIHIDATGVTQTDGILVHIDSASTALTATGRLLLVDHTGASGTSAVIAEVKSAATDETVVAQVLASAALAAGKVLNLSAVAMTTGKALSIDNLDALTTGNGISVTSNSADTTARPLVFVKNDHASATGTNCLELTNDSTAAPIKTTSAAVSTNFFRVGAFNGVTLWAGNGNTANTALSGTAGDIIFNAGSNKPEYCTGTTNWTALV